MRPVRFPAEDRKDGARGFVLLTVLVVVMLSSMLAVSLLYAVRADATAQAAARRGEQAWIAAMSGVYRALAVARNGLNGEPEWADNPGAFRHQEVVNDGSDRWYFSVWSASEIDPTTVRFGLSDEASRLNVRAVPPAWVDALPGLEAEGTDPNAQPADVPSPGSESLGPDATDAAAAGLAGADEGDTNAPPALALPDDSVAGFLAARGLGPEILFGEDANGNLRLDPNEDDGDASPPSDNQDGRLEPGWRAFLTALSYEPNADAAGQPRVNLNDTNASLAALNLPPATLRYLDAIHAAGQRLNHVADLLEARTTVQDPKRGPSEIDSGIGGDQLPGLLDRCTATNATVLTGLVNVNTAPAPVLESLPGVDATLADGIVSTRGVLGPDEKRTIAWLYTRGLVAAPAFRQLAPFLTARAFQFRFHCVGYGVPSGRSKVVEAVIDIAARPPRLVALRDLSRLGFPLPLSLLDADTGLTATPTPPTPRQRPSVVGASAGAMLASLRRPSGF